MSGREFSDRPPKRPERQNEVTASGSNPAVDSGFSLAKWRGRGVFLWPMFKCPSQLAVSVIASALAVTLGSLCPVIECHC